MDPPVKINKDALLNILDAAVDAFKRECLGVLIGRKPSLRQNRYLIQRASQFSSLQFRRNTEVKQAPRAVERLEKLFTHPSGAFSRLGEFHAHPEWGSHKRFPFGEADIASMVTNKCEIEIIATISSARDELPWRQEQDGSLRGTLADWDIALHAYRLVSDKDEKSGFWVQELRIVAPEAIKALNCRRKKK